MNPQPRNNPSELKERYNKIRRMTPENYMEIVSEPVKESKIVYPKNELVKCLDCES